MAAEIDSDSMAPKWMWRPAAKFDIGSVARFGDTTDKHEPWVYGILKNVEKGHYGLQYVCEANCYEDEDQRFFYCQIQYDANKEP